MTTDHSNKNDELEKESVMNTVLALFEPEAIRPALETLSANGFGSDELAVVSLPGHIPDYLMGEAQSAAGEGMAVGAATGGLMGILGTLAASTIPGLELTVVSGLLGTAAGGAVGAYLGGLYTMRAETQDEIDLKDALDAGEVLLLVHTTEARAERAAELLAAAGGRHVETQTIPKDESAG